MEQILYASMTDIPNILALMNRSTGTETPSDWYVKDDEDFVRRHIGGEMQAKDSQSHNASEGYSLKYIVDGEFAAFLIVRHPGEAEDNLGQYLSENCADRQTASGNVQTCGESDLTVLLSRVAHMESAAVHPAHRGKGLQGKLLARAEEIEIARGTKFLMATVHPDNIYSLRNLEAAGYQCILETAKYGGLRRKVMCKVLYAEGEAFLRREIL